MPAPAVDRHRVLAHRAVAHDLVAPGTGDVVLGVGLQDYPPGRSALPSLTLRTGPHRPQTGLALVHGVRGALHLHRADDLALLRGALHVADGRDWARQTMATFGDELAEAGITFAAALDEVAAAMATVMADGTPRTKGELSGAISPAVDPRLAPWCESCGAAHVHDMLFRLATLHAGLTVQVDLALASQFRYVRSGDETRAATDESRAELVRRFLAAFGPAKPAHLATWLGLRPAAARRWWDRVAGELRPVRVADAKLWVPADDVDRLADAPPARGIRLLPPYDPLTELADRELLAPDADRRRKIWQAVANPGIVWVDGEIVGVWRARTRNDRLTVRVEPFVPLSAAQLRAAEADLEVFRTAAGATTVELRI
ncbi:winged helix DNA-binding domain-containing protein [Pseudonocardia sp. DSM 110487]|uniref:winged helix DNA-binding domain-containing protein n=1 Tax=Pseudonocardia sp. DSM 110487 TaxID=2865833 RepID=UPI001C69A40A|nr:winged helix DNA-binding domain-containing protein [Pseudonocardia sp. DSM 110487]QYN37717.1 winged helix DNA-binding domain-containing protein [Pseudonocardia sp. DSM 110487]